MEPAKHSKPPRSRGSASQASCAACGIRRRRRPPPSSSYPDPETSSSRISEIKLYSEQGSTAKIYIGRLDGKDVLIKVFLKKDIENQTKEAILQNQAYHILKVNQAEIYAEFMRLIEGMTYANPDKVKMIEETPPTAEVPGIIDSGPYEAICEIYSREIPNEDGDDVGQVIIMEYIPEPTVFQDIKVKNVEKIELYKNWSGRDDVEPIENTDDTYFEMRERNMDLYSKEYNFLTNLLVAVLNVLNKYGVSHNDVSLKNVMVTFEGGRIKTIYLIDFGQAENADREMGNDNQFTLFDMGGLLHHAKTWFPALYAGAKHRKKRKKRKTKRRTRISGAKKTRRYKTRRTRNKRR
jgi:serine/threonine protein kinase